MTIKAGAILTALIAADTTSDLNFIWFQDETGKPVQYNMPKAWEGAYCGLLDVHS